MVRVLRAGGLPWHPRRFHCGRDGGKTGSAGSKGSVNQSRGREGFPPDGRAWPLQRFGGSIAAERGFRDGSDFFGASTVSGQPNGIYPVDSVFFRTGRRRYVMNARVSRLRWSAPELYRFCLQAAYATKVSVFHSGFSPASEPVNQPQRIRSQPGPVRAGPAPGQLADFFERVRPCPAFAVKQAQLLQYPGKLPFRADPAHRMAISSLS